MMAKIINPQIRIDFLGLDPFFLVEPNKTIDIQKDLSEEENEARVEIYNLNESTRKRIDQAAANNDLISISFSAARRASEEPVQAFLGEIDRAKSKLLRPGVETSIECTSQKLNHRSFYFNQTFADETPIADIIEALVEAVGLPRGNSFDLPTSSILISESFSGPAFPILKRYVFDLGLYCYIMDGKLYITDVGAPPNPEAIVLDPMHMLSSPEPKTRNDRTLVEMKTIIENNTRDPFEKRKKNRKKKKKDVKVIGQNDSVEYTAVDATIKGMTFEMIGQPAINPDEVVSSGDNLYRVIDVNHYGDDFQDGLTTELQTDEYDQTSGSLLDDFGDLAV